jgi:flap endonuclease-1
MAILIGTDFNEGIKGIGPKTSLKLIKKNGNVENAIATIGSKTVPSFEEIKEIRKIFLEPEVEKNYSINWKSANRKAVMEILCDKHQFKKERVEPILDKYSNVESMMKQKTLF